MTLEGYWEGGTWVYQAQITNGAGGGGAVSIVVTPGAGNEMEILYGSLTNGDGTGRSAVIKIRDDGDNDLAHLINVGYSLGAASTICIPLFDQATDGAHAGSGTRLILSGGMDLIMQLSSVAASQDGVFSLVARIRGDIPTVTETGQSTPTITINTEKVL